MKIAVIDTNQYKFTQDIIDHWRSTGYDVKPFHTCHEEYMRWADLLWFDCVDNNLVCATRRMPDVIKGKRIIARAIDIDVWASHYNSVDWSKVDDLVFIASHIQKWVVTKRKMPECLRIHLVPCGVDLDRFTLRQDPAHSRDVAVVMRLWHGKGIDLLIQAILQNPEFHFHICGQWGLNGLEQGWYRSYINEMLEKAKNWTHIERVDDMNAWLENKSYALICSKKEAFSYAAAEGAAKGLKPLIHTFYGHGTIWPRSWCWQTLDELRKKLNGYCVPEAYRGYIETVYPLTKMLEKIDDILTN